MGLAQRLNRWCQDDWTSSTCNLPRKRRDITEQIVESGVKHHTNKHIKHVIHLFVVDAMRFTVTDSQLKTDETVELSSGCITIEKTSAVKRCKFKCGMRYVSDVPLPDNYVGVSVITERRPCKFVSLTSSLNLFILHRLRNKV